MDDYKEFWKTRIAGALNALLAESGLEGTIRSAQVIAETPPKPDMGDLGFPMFGFAKLFRKGPSQIAQAAVLALGKIPPPEGAGVRGEAAEGPYLNVRLNRGEASAALLARVLDGEENSAGGGFGPAGFGRPRTMAGSRVMVEFSSPNTNKPLHLGHLRNDVLGESVSRILAACGAEVRKVCIINDRGVHICKSMLAYRNTGGAKPPSRRVLKAITSWGTGMSDSTG